MYNAWRFNSFLAHSGIGFKRKTYVVNDDFAFYIEFASWILYVRRECLTAKRLLKFYSEDIDKIPTVSPSRWNLIRRWHATQFYICDQYLISILEVSIWSNNGNIGLIKEIGLEWFTLG